MYQAVKKEQNAWHPDKIYSKGEGEDHGGKGKNNICEDDQVRSKQKDSMFKMFSASLQIKISTATDDISISNITMIFFFFILKAMQIEYI